VPGTRCRACPITVPASRRPGKSDLPACGYHVRFVPTLWTTTCDLAADTAHCRPRITSGIRGPRRVTFRDRATGVSGRHLRVRQVDAGGSAGGNPGRAASGTGRRAPPARLGTAADGRVPPGRRGTRGRRRLGDRRQLQQRQGPGLGPGGHRRLARPAETHGDAPGRLAHAAPGRAAQGTVERQPRALAELLHLGPEQSVISWAWHKHAPDRARYAAAAADPANAHLRFITLASNREVARFLAGARSEAGAAAVRPPRAPRAPR
jgi:hypothetical protein